MAKKFKIFAFTPQEEERYAIIPCGLYFNKGISHAQKGDMIVFCDGYRQTKKILTDKCTLSVNSPLFTFMLRSLYRGRNKIPENYFSHWDSVALIEDFGKCAVSHQSAVLIKFKEIEDGEKTEVRK